MTLINTPLDAVSSFDILDILLYLNKEKIISANKKGDGEAEITYKDNKNNKIVSGFIRILFYNNQTNLHPEDKELLTLILHKSLNRKSSQLEIKLGTAKEIVSALGWNEKEEAYTCLLESLQRLYCVTIETDMFLFFNADVFSRTIFSLFSDFSISSDDEAECTPFISVTWTGPVFDWINEYYKNMI